MNIINKVPSRVRHDTRIRLLRVVEVNDITPLMRRITLSGDELKGFTSLGFDDHVKVFFPPPGEDPVQPTLGPDGLVFPDGYKRPPMRDYTPRRYDAAANRLDLDFVLHGDGPASIWAANVRVGQAAMIGGPRGSMIVPDTFDWYLLAGDETALPAIGRRLEELPAGTRAIAVIEVASPAEEQRLESAAQADIHWLHRNGAPAGTTDLIEKAIAGLALPEGTGFSFVAGEARMTRTVRRHLVEERGQPAELVKAAGYWVLGEADAHQPH